MATTAICRGSSSKTEIKGSTAMKGTLIYSAELVMLGGGCAYTATSTDVT